MSEQLFNLAQMEAVASGNQEFIDKMVNMFLDMTPGLVERISNGLQMQDWEEVKSAAHKMKPSVDMMGISSLHDVVRSIEGNAKTGENLEQIPDLLVTLQDTLEQVYDQMRNR